MKKILITGSRGRIGADLKEFLKQDYEITELGKGEELSEEKFNVDAIIHLAAKTPRKGREYSLREYIETNVELTKNILSYASKQNVKTIIIPTSWSWMFKLGDYQYSKLLQEKVAEKYREIGLNVIPIDFPEFINQSYKGVIQIITDKIKNNNKTTVDMINISTITTKDIADVFREFIEGNNQKANDLYKKSIDTFDLYKKIKSIIKKEFPDKLKYLKKGKTKMRNLIIKDNNIIIFPDFKVEKRG